MQHCLKLFLVFQLGQIVSEIYKKKLSVNCNDNHRFSKSLAAVNNENVVAYQNFLLSRSYLFMVIFSPDINLKDGKIHHLITKKVLDDKQSHVLGSLLDLVCNHLKKYIAKCRSMPGYTLIKQKPLKLTGFFTNKQSYSSERSELRDVQSQNKMFRIQIAWANENDVLMDDLKQFVTNTLPRSLSTIDGLPYKGQKSKILTVYKSRYPDAFLVNLKLSEFDVIIIGAMFVIYHPPLRSYNTFAEYLQHVFVRNILCYYGYGIEAVHICFDEQSFEFVSPKELESSRRDSDKFENPFVQNFELEPESLLPSDWKKFLNIRENKKSLINLACSEFLKIGMKKLKQNQKLVIGGGFSACGISKAVISNKVVSLMDLNSNIHEGDSRVWFHAFAESKLKIIILSADNDTYHIGLSLLNKYPNKHICVALNTQFETVIDMNKLAILMKYDHDFISITDFITSVIPVLFVATGCDYVSFFKGHTKQSFFYTLTKHAEFISGGKFPFS